MFGILHFLKYDIVRKWITYIRSIYTDHRIWVESEATAVSSRNNDKRLHPQFQIDGFGDPLTSR